MKPSQRSRKSSWLYTFTTNIFFTRLFHFIAYIFFFCSMRHRSSATISESEPMLDLAPESTSQQPFYSFDRVFLRRLARIFHILFPSSPHEQIWSFSPKIRQRSLFWLYITFIALSCGCEILYYYTGLLPSRFYAVLSSSDLQGFIRFILPCLLLVFGTAAVCIRAFLSFVSNWSLFIRGRAYWHLWEDCSHWKHDNYWHNTCMIVTFNPTSCIRWSCHAIQSITRKHGSSCHNDIYNWTITTIGIRGLLKTSTSLQSHYGRLWRIWSLHLSLWFTILGNAGPSAEPWVPSWYMDTLLWARYWVVCSSSLSWTPCSIKSLPKAILGMCV